MNRLMETYVIRIKEGGTETEIMRRIIGNYDGYWFGIISSIKIQETHEVFDCFHVIFVMPLTKIYFFREFHAATR